MRVRAAQGVVAFGQAPQIVVAARGLAGQIDADADFIVQHTALIVPHAQQPAQAEGGFGGEVRLAAAPHLVRKVAQAGQQDRHGVALRLDEFQVIAGIPPAAARIDGGAGGDKRADDGAVRDLGRGIGGGMGIV